MTTIIQSFSLRVSPVYWRGGGVPCEKGMMWLCLICIGKKGLSINKREGDISIDMGLSKDLFKENATISLNVKDLLDQRGWKNETFNDNFYNDYEFRWGVRRIVLNFIYRFNQKKNQRNPQGFNNQGEF